MTSILSAQPKSGYGLIRDWLVGEKGRLNQYVAADCDGIIAGLYEYYVSMWQLMPAN